MLRHRSLVSGGSSLSRMPFASHIMRQASTDLGPIWGRVSSITIRHCARSRNLSTACHFLREKPSIRGVNLFLRQKVGKGGTPKEESKSAKNKNLSLILLSVIIGTVGLSYLSVPLYRLFCQQTGYGGTVKTGKTPKEQYQMRTDRPLTVNFSSSVNSSIPWKFYPVTHSVKLVPGQPVLIFYKAENPTDEDIVGIAAYNVTPAKAGVYFHKTECFCFEEQLLPAHSVVDLPVLFSIDKEFADDPHMTGVYHIVLNYTFFRSKDFEGLPEDDEKEEQKESTAQFKRMD